MWVLRLGDGTEESHARDAGRPGGGVALRRRAVRRLLRGAVRWSTPASPSTRRRCARPSTPGSRRCSHEATLTLPEVDPGGDRGPSRRAHPADGLPARRDAAPDPLAPGGDVVTDTRSRLGRRGVGARPGGPGRDDRGPRHPAVGRGRRGRRRAGCDHPDVLRLSRDGHHPRRPARRASAEPGYDDVRVDFVLAPAWTTDWMTEEGRRKLEEFGIAPPTARRRRRPGLADAVACAARSAARPTPAS